MLYKIVLKNSLSLQTNDSVKLINQSKNDTFSTEYRELTTIKTD